MQTGGNSDFNVGHFYVLIQGLDSRRTTLGSDTSSRWIQTGAGSCKRSAP